MKTYNSIKAHYSRRNIAVSISAILFSCLMINTTSAQGRRGGGVGREFGNQDFGGRQSNSRQQFSQMPERNNISNAPVRSNSNAGFNHVTRQPGNDRNFHSETNNFPAAHPDRNINGGNNNINRGRDNEQGFNRPSNYGYGNQERNNFNRGLYTYNRPGFRPEYRYTKPVYNRYNPGWRYGYLPARNSYFYHLPSNYFSINFGGFGYRYYDGVFYRPYNNLFTVIAPPIGICINMLPAGYSRIYVDDYPYYYYNGTYYDQRGSNYFVVSPPLGAVVESLPQGYETIVIDGETYYTVDGAQYKPVVQENGEIWYQVVKAN